MATTPSGFDTPIYVTKPVLPRLESFHVLLSEIWEAAYLTNDGPQHQALEAALSRYLDCPNLSLFSNGTTALMIACRALGLTGEVITTPFTFPATPHVLSWNGLAPVFADIDPETMNLDPARIEPLITEKTSAILAVHVFGTPCDVDGLQKIADKHRLRIIYDGAHAFGSSVDGRNVAQFGDATMFSFHATKLFHTAEGGALVVRDEAVKEKTDYLKNFGIRDETTVVMPGINGKMNELQAALGRLTLDMVPAEQESRRRVGAIYRRRLASVEGLSLPVEPPNVTTSQQYFPIRIDAAASGVTRDFVCDELRKFNVYSRKYFYPLCSDYDFYREPNINLPVAHKVVSEILCLPFYGALTEGQVETICDILLYLFASGPAAKRK